MRVIYPMPRKPDYDGTYSYATGLLTALRGRVDIHPIPLRGRLEFLHSSFSDGDLIHNPMSHYYLYRKQPLPLVLTMMDAVPFTPTPWLTLKTQLYHRTVGKRALKNADRIITISQNSFKDFIKIGVPKDKLTVIYPAVNDIFFLPPMLNQQAVEQKCGIVSPYILYVGGFNPRKNVDRLIKTFVAAKTRYQLVLAGCRGWSNETTWDLVKKHGVITVPNPSVSEIHDLMSYCSLFVFPSLYEGFGLPIAEAMASGCPVACSDRSAMPEVIGDTGVLFNPERIPIDLFNNIPDPKRSKERAKDLFRWKDVVRETIGVYRECIENTTV